MPDPTKKTISATRYVVDEATGCWVWSGAKNTHGYGHLKLRGRYWQAHRLSYTEAKGAIPDDLVIDHLCRCRACINPDHLEPVTNGENLHRGQGPTAIRAAQVVCLRGHPFTEENTYRPKRGGRDCRACKRLRDREYRNARSA